MSQNQKTETTFIHGYYNRLKKPVTLDIESKGISIFLKPGDYVLNGIGQKVNDPLLDAYDRDLASYTRKEAVPYVLIDETVGYKTPVTTGVIPKNEYGFTPTRVNFRQGNTVNENVTGKPINSLESLNIRVNEGEDEQEESHEAVKTAPLTKMVFCPVDGAKFDTLESMMEYTEKKYPDKFKIWFNSPSIYTNEEPTREVSLQNKT